MIQDREVKSLWDAVEDLGRRVAELEGAGRESPTQFDYVASPTSKRRTFHNRDCKFAGSFMQGGNGFREFRTPEEAVAAGMVPCKSCAP